LPVRKRLFRPGNASSDTHVHIHRHFVLVHEALSY
jgi:hypothetical protein